MHEYYNQQPVGKIMNKFTAIVVTMLTAFVFAACSDEETTSVTPSTVSFQTDVRGVFNTKCVECHQPGGAGEVLNLKTDSVWRILAYNRSPNSKSWYYVIYNNRTESLLFRKVNDDAPPFGLPMPIGEKMSKAEIEKIGVWIDEGAMNN
jgi:mono/diheme cytochrome c family protein